MNFIIQYRHLDETEIRIKEVPQHCFSIQCVLDHIEQFPMEKMESIIYRIKDQNDTDGNMYWFRIYINSELVFSMDGSIHFGKTANALLQKWIEANSDFCDQSRPINDRGKYYQREDNVCWYCDEWFFVGTIEINKTTDWQNLIWLE